MTFDKTSELANQVARLLRSARIDLCDEKRAQADIASLLESQRIAFDREHRLSESDIVDFWLAGFALEVKLRANKKAIFRQLERYAKHEAVTGLALASCTSMGLPPEINGKPVYFVRLAQGWI